MQVFQGRNGAPTERETYPLDDISERLQISCQTLVRWVDRHLVDGTLAWTLTDDNEEQRVIHLRGDKLPELKAFAAEYREGRVSRTEARHILKMIDAKRIKKMVRAGDLETVQEDDETWVIVGSIEDYLRGVEAERAEGEPEL